MAQEGRLLAAALGDPARPLTQEEARQLLSRLNRRSASRLRIVDISGNILADSVHLGPRREPGEGGEELLEPTGRQSWVYLLGSKAFRVYQRIFQPLAGGDGSDTDAGPKELLQRAEIQRALGGEYGAASRLTPGQRSLTLHSALPIRQGGEVVGVALVSRSTYRLLQSLYGMRLKLFRIFLLSVLAAVILSLLVATTIVRPLRRLRLQAAAVVDRRGRLRGHFEGSRKLDEIGELSRALAALSHRLEEHIRLMESFGADVAHEFKNPLATIRVAAETAAEVEDGAERRRFLGLIQRQVSRMERLLTSARELTRLDAELEQEERHQVDLAALTEEILEGFRLRWGDSLKFQFRRPEGPATTLASPERLAQIVENLLDNAVSFSPPGSLLEIALVREENRLELTVADQGPGIPEEHREKIFRRFFSYRPVSPDRPGSSERPGSSQRDGAAPAAEHTGLGLSVVHAIAEGYGGGVSATNRAGGGAEFRVELPAAS
jgi:two-component system sensor histidine kinase ChvG